MKKGDKVILKPINNAARRSKKLIHSEVTKVGRLYFTVDHLSYTFNLITMFHNSKFSADYKAYKDIAGIVEEDEIRALEKKIRDKMGIGHTRYSLEKLRKVDGILF